MWEERKEVLCVWYKPFATRTRTETERTYPLVLLLTAELLEIGAERERVLCVFFLCVLIYFY